MQIKALNADEIIAEMGNSDCPFDNDTSRQVRELIAAEIADGNDVEWKSVIQPLDGEPFFYDSGGLHNLVAMLHAEDGMEVCYVIPCYGAVERGLNGVNPARSADFESLSPTIQFMKELNSGMEPPGEKLQQLNDSWISEGYVLIHAKPMQSGAWFWVGKHKKFVYAGTEDVGLPNYHGNPFWALAGFCIERLSKKNGLNEWEYMRDTVLAYEKQKSVQPEVWRDKNIKWHPINLMLMNLELNVFRLHDGLGESADIADAVTNRSLYRQYRNVITGAISMYEDLLASRDVFRIALSGVSPQGVERAWQSVTERTARLSQLMREADERYAKKSGANN